MGKLKVYGGNEMVAGRQMRVIVAAHSMNEVARLLDATVYQVRNYWAETGNKCERETALAEPGTVFVAENSYRSNTVYHKRDEMVAEYRRRYESEGQG
jgi:hypothetical protein